MATMTLAYVTPEVLQWARESIGYSLSDAAAKIGIRTWQLQAAEEGVELLTLKQAETAADAYERPLATLFRPEPPEEEPQEAQFRRLPGTPEPPWQPEMHVLARRVRQRQSAAADLQDLLEDGPTWSEALARLHVDHEALAEAARTVLGVGFDEQSSWQDASGYVPLRQWIDAVEGLGVLVMQDGSMPVDTMRGFAAPHPTTPVIVLNSKDDPRARAFTLIHELAHLLRANRGERITPATEEWCERFAGEVLMPTRLLERVFRRSTRATLVAVIDEVALTFGVTPLSAAVRARRTRLASREDMREVIKQIRVRPHRERGGGGDYYKNTVARLGPSYIQLVLSALDSQALTYPSASALLGVKVNFFEKLRDHVEHRAEGT